MKKLLLILLCLPLLFSCGENEKINELEERIDKIQKIIEEQAVEICLSDFFNKVENQEVKTVTFITNKNYAEVELNNGSYVNFRYSEIRYVKEQIGLKQSDNYQINIDIRTESPYFR